jgi:hypothetical protein
MFSVFPRQRPELVYNAATLARRHLRTRAAYSKRPELDDIPAPARI